jgi:hypothetical protein
VGVERIGVVFPALAHSAPHNFIGITHLSSLLQNNPAEAGNKTNTT